MYRNLLPQLGGEVFLTDSGIETDLIFNSGFELPEFAAFVLVDDDRGRAALAEYFQRHVEIAVAASVRGDHGDADLAGQPGLGSVARLRPQLNCAGSMRRRSAWWTESAAAFTEDATAPPGQRVHRTAGRRLPAVRADE